MCPPCIFSQSKRVIRSDICLPKMKRMQEFCTFGINNKILLVKMIRVIFTRKIRNDSLIDFF